MTEQEKTRLSNLSNLELVEELLRYQQDVDQYHILRASVDYRSEQWQVYHNKLYESSQDVIEVKYMIVHRMGGCAGKGN